MADSRVDASYRAQDTVRKVQCRMMTRHLAIAYFALLLVCSVAQGQNETKPRRKVKALPRYMANTPQPIPDELKLPGAPKTVRDVQCYASFTTSSTMQEVVRKCGIPDEHQGSGIYIFLFDMTDGTIVAIGTSDLKHLMYITHIQTRGSHSLLNRVPEEGFSITLERTACLGSCPDYKVTIRGNGTVCYEGRAYVAVKGIRTTAIPASVVQKLQQKLRGEKFLHWPEQNQVCVDFAETKITATLDGQKKEVIEGCNQPGKVLQLAREIDQISGAERWTIKPR